MQKENHLPIYKIVFVVCHPDDEAIWIGGMLSALSSFTFVESSVICLSGHSPNSPREDEFIAAKDIARYSKGIVLGGHLTEANQPLPYTSETVEDGLNRLKLSIKDIALLITHSPYGDEHLHPHHAQTYKELLEWTKKKNIPFGFFSCLPLPYLWHKPLLKNLKRINNFHLLSFCECRPFYFIIKNLINKIANLYYKQPKYYFLFNTDEQKKLKMLHCYESVDLALFKEGYSMFTNACESLYIFDSKGLKPFLAIMNAMNIPGSKDLFGNISLRESIRNKLYFWRSRKR